MNTRLENLVLSGLVALAVSTAVSGATPLSDSKPKHGISTAALSRTSGPSDADKLASLARRVDALQVRLARVNEQANAAALDAGAAVSLTDCISGGVFLIRNPDDTVSVDPDGTNPDSIAVPALDMKCLGQTP